MEENYNNENQESEMTPPSYKYKFVRVVTLTFIFLLLFFALSYAGVETTSSSSFCSKCHEMKPQFYTWKASTHSEVDCVSCHVEPGLEAQLKAKAGNVEEVYKKFTQTYTAPIRMPKEIPDSACEKCHNINTRSFTPSGDLIIPHDKHKEEDIKCVQCHSGVAHGKIADRQMTYQADYLKWDEKVGHAAMSERKFVQPEMATCMECHKVRNAPLECSACHTSGMIPESHEEKDFKYKTHGTQASKELKDCHFCHEYMSKKDLEGFEEPSTLSHFLKQESKEPKKTEQDYAKENTYCLDCHIIRPPSHTTYFMYEHGTLANENKRRCFTCHDNQKKDNTPSNIATCGSCHPSTHKNNRWRTSHPVTLKPNQKVVESCYTCHSRPTCMACHTTKSS